MLRFWVALGWALVTFLHSESETRSLAFHFKPYRLSKLNHVNVDVQPNFAQSLIETGFDETNEGTINQPHEQPRRRHGNFKHQHSPFHQQFSPSFDVTFPNENVSGLAHQKRSVPLTERAVDRVALRILNLGSSVVAGYVSSDQNGYRYGLRSALVRDGHHVNMIGSLKFGFMGDNDVEGWGGYRIDQISAKADLSLPQLPNVVCIEAGANDVYQNFDTGGMTARMGQLLDKINAAVPDVTIILSTLPPNSNAAQFVTMNQFNNNLTALIAPKNAAGSKIFLVNCTSSWWTIYDVPLNNHPDYAGYLKMARVFYDGVAKARSVGAITAPHTPAGGIDDSSPPDKVNGTQCPKNPANEVGPLRTGLETGSNDGGYVAGQTLHSTVYDISKVGGTTLITSLNLYWADIDGDGLDDYITVQPDLKTMYVAYSLGAGQFTAAVTVDLTKFIGWPCTKDDIVFADIGGDKRADFCCTSGAGAINCAKNLYASRSSLTFAPITSWALAVAGYTGARNRIADIDGDGRADRMVITSTGDIIAWRNGGTGDTPIWQSLGTVSTNKTFSDADGIRLVDLNGDGRADILWMDTTGKVTTWINQRGFTAGSLAPVWYPAGVTHPGYSATTSRQLISFGKIYGTSRTDPIWGQIKADMVKATDTTGKATTFQIAENTGKNGVRVKGDGVRFCDLRNRGKDDYIWISKEGIVTVSGNEQNLTPGTWIAYGNVITLNRNRNDVHFADVTGDGKCDILMVDKATGSTTMWRNDFDPVKDTFAFTNVGVISGGATCTQGLSQGPSMFDLGVRFADVNGDGKADYLCIANDGTTTAFINGGLNAFAAVGTIKSPTGVERIDVRFADVNGDGRADYVVIDKFTGSYNASINSNTSTTITFVDQGPLSPGGRARGAAVYFASLNGTLRADYVAVDPATAIHDTWTNICPGAWGPLRPPPILPLDPSNPESGTLR